MRDAKIDDRPARRRAPSGLAVVLAALLAALAWAGAAEVVRGASKPRPKCFGAAERDHLFRCRNPSLDRMVVPRPANAVLQPNSPCAVIYRKREIYVCQFGRRESEAVGTIALVGDSHASHWRAGLARMAQARQWRGLSITQDACPFSAANLLVLERKRKACREWKGATLAWFQEHPEVSTVFFSGHNGLTVGIRDPEADFEAQVQGFLDAWKLLPASVERVVVIRDTPRMATGTHDCVERELRRGKRPGIACAISRKRYLRPDPADIAARRYKTDRAESIDMSRYFCGKEVCYPVIGGALVNKDTTHITRVYSETLGRYLHRRYRRLKFGR